MKRFLILLCIAICTAFSSGHKNPDYGMQSDAEQMLTDNMGNVYLVHKDQLLKYNGKLTFQKEFSNKNYGFISSADVTNPLRILLFYRQFGRLLFLDNTLSQNGNAVALEELGFPLASLAASSHDNGLWIYNPQDFEMVRLNHALTPEYKTGNLSQVLGIELQPDFLIEKDNHVFLNNPASGILVFDVFGTFIKTAPIKNLHTFQIVDDEIIYFEEGTLKSWNIKTSETSVYVEPTDTNALNMRLEKGAVYVHNKDSVHVYNRIK